MGGALAVLYGIYIYIYIYIYTGAFVYGMQEEPCRNRGRDSGPHTVFAHDVNLQCILLVVC